MNPESNHQIGQSRNREYEQTYGNKYPSKNDQKAAKKKRPFLSTIALFIGKLNK